MIQVFFRTRNIKTQKIGTHMQAFPLKKREKEQELFSFFQTDLQPHLQRSES